MLSQGTTLSLDAYGSTTLSENRILTYRFQSVFLNNYLGGNAFLGQNHYIGYFGRSTSIEAGEINGWGRSLISGRGFKVSQRFGRNTIGGIYTYSPSGGGSRSSNGYALYHNYLTSAVNWSNFYSHSNDFRLLLNGDLVNTYATFKINKIHQLNIGGGVNNERSTAINGLSVDGYGFDLGYSDCRCRHATTKRNRMDAQ